MEEGEALGQRSCLVSASIGFVCAPCLPRYTPTTVDEKLASERRREFTGTLYREKTAGFQVCVLQKDHVSVRGVGKPAPDEIQGTAKPSAPRLRAFPGVAALLNC